MLSLYVTVARFVCCVEYATNWSCLLVAVACCCPVLAVCLVSELIPAAYPSICQPSALAQAAIAGGICFFAPYVASYKSPYLMTDQRAIGFCQHAPIPDLQILVYVSFAFDAYRAMFWMLLVCQPCLA